MWPQCDVATVCTFYKLSNNGGVDRSKFVEKFYSNYNIANRWIEFKRLNEKLESEIDKRTDVLAMTFKG